MFERLMRIASWLCICGGIATGAYASYALAIGEVVVESRGAGKSTYVLHQQPGPFYGFVAFYFICALIFIAIGITAKGKKK